MRNYLLWFYSVMKLTDQVSGCTWDAVTPLLGISAREIILDNSKYDPYFNVSPSSTGCDTTNMTSELYTYPTTAG